MGAHKPTAAAWEALGTSVVVVVAQADALAHARELVSAELDAVDHACSRFRSDSELSRLNARSGRRVAVSALLAEALEVALRAAELTDGDVDPTIGSALTLSGYDRDWKLLPAPGDAPEPGVAVLARRRSGWRTVELDREAASVRVPSGIQLDLGASAKAWAADRAARGVLEATGSGVLVSLGGDISTAGTAPAGGWRVHVTEDHRSGPDAPGQTVAIDGGGLATSSTTVRRWRHRGRVMHHIIDPASGAPVRGLWRTASVAAADCTDANIASTAALVRGERALAWLAELGLPARLVGCDGTVRTVGRWPQELAA